MLARFFVAIGGLVVLALTLALVGPYLIDWTSYRADFEREASAILGRKVTVQGTASARLLPFPSVAFNDIAVADEEGKPALTMESFSMDAELAPLLSGEVRIFDMRMVRPKGRVVIGADGAIDWAVRPARPFGARRTSVERLAITEGSVEVVNRGSGRTDLVTELNADLSAKALTGPWRMTGSARLDGMLTSLSVSTGTLDPGGETRLRIRAEPTARRLAVEADGALRLENGRASYAGQFRVLPFADDAQKDAAAQPPPYRLSGSFALDGSRLTADPFRFETGPADDPYAATGKGLLDWSAAPRFELTAQGDQVRLDEAELARARGLSFRQRMTALGDALFAVPRPSIPGRIAVTLPAVVAGDTTVRDVELRAEPAEGGWRIGSLAATLPGRTRLEASGLLAIADQPSFTGSLLLAIAQPSGFAAWVSHDVDSAIRRLPGAGFRANVSFSPGEQVFRDLELQLGDARFRGEASNRIPASGETQTRLDIAGGALDLDGLAAFASLFLDERGAARFGERGIELALKAGPVNLAGLSAGTVDAAMRLKGGSLDIDRLSVNGLAGATFSATGHVSDLATRPSGSLDVSVEAGDLGPLVAAAAARLPAIPALAAAEKRVRGFPTLLADTRLNLVASITPQPDGSADLAGNLTGRAGGTDLNVELGASGTPAEPAGAHLSLKLGAKNENAAALLALAGLPTLPVGELGPGALDVSAAGTLASLEGSARLSGDRFAAFFSGSAGLSGTERFAKGKASIEASDIEPWLMTVGTRLPGMGFGRAVDLEAEADYGDGLLVLSDISGTIDENAVEGDLNAEFKGAKPHLTGQLDLDELDLDEALAAVLGEEALAPDAGGGQPSAAFAPRADTPFSAEVGVTAASVSAGPATAYDASLSLSLSDEGLRVSEFQGKMADGTLSGLAEVKNTGGTALLTGQFQLAGADLGRLLSVGGIEATGDLSASVSATGKSVEALLTSLSGAGTASATSLTVPGLAPDALRAFLARADAMGRDVDASRVAALVPEIARTGRFVAAPVETAFTVAAGVARTPAVKLVNPAATLSAELQLNLAELTVGGRGELAYQPGDEALVGSEPVLRLALSGPLAQPELTVDSEPLAQFLTQRALEIEQARVEALQSALLEKQRLRREARYYASLQRERDRAAEELRRQQEQEKARQDEAARRAAAAAKAAQDAAAETARRTAEAEAARRAAEAEARRAAADAPAATLPRSPVPESRPDLNLRMEDGLVVPQAPSGLF